MKPCKTCPFLKGTQNFGRVDWLQDCVKGFESNVFDHSCHVTDERADGYIGGEERSCVGFLALLKKEGVDCATPKAWQEMTAGKINFNDLPTEDVFDSRREFLDHHARAIFLANRVAINGLKILEEK